MATAAVFLLGSAHSLQADPVNAGNGTAFRLDADSSYTEGCFDPCLCPIWMSDTMRGVFWLAYTGQTATGVHTYSVEEVNFIVQTSNGDEIPIIGSGQYSIRYGAAGDPTILEQRMELDLQVGSDAVQHFDSGWVPFSNSTPAGGIDIAVSINGMYCYDRVVDISAHRVPDSEIARYALSSGATFQRGCWDPCDCPLEEERPMAGTFLLVPLSNNSLFQEFAVMRARWVVAAPSNVGSILITGFGRYFVGGEVAVMQRIILDMIVGSKPRQHFDSGQVSGGGGFPHIDVTASINGMVCFDTVLHVVADPEGGQVCGGFAGIGCPPGEFCKLPVGQCCCDFQGICTPIPTGCPENYDPVCGCDGVTYGNECEAEAAGMSIDHYGPCASSCGPNEPPCPPDSFCKLPIGVCDNTQPGTCTVMGDACPAIWDPVCGCDDITYTNECEADRAGVSIAHTGECSVTTCAATRYLSGPSIADYTYCPGTEENVIIALDPPAGATAIALEDSPPPAWAVTYINNGGTYDAVHHKVKWGPFFAPFPGNVSYGTMPSNDTSGPKCFNGTISVDGSTQTICGDTCLDPCCPNLAADTPQPPCESCPTADCGQCNNGACEDGRVSLCEVIGYACAWMQGCNDNLAGMTRAAYIWRNGECYCWDGANWYPSTCDPAGNTCCDSADGDPTDGDHSGGRGKESIPLVGRVLSLRKHAATGLSTYRVSVLLEPPLGTSASALELNVPLGWKVVDIKEGGRFDDVHGKVKWGPFFDGLRRKLSIVVRPVRGYAPSKDLAANPELGTWTGTAAFDGEIVPVEVRR